MSTTRDIIIHSILYYELIKPYFKGKTASTKPMYSRNLIHLVCMNIHPMQLHSAVVGETLHNVWFVASLYKSAVLGFFLRRMGCTLNMV